MRWQGREQSENVEDRRGMGGRGMATVGGGGAIVLVILGLLFGVDPAQLLGPGGGGQPGAVQPIDPAEQPLVEFSKVVFRDTEIVWDEQFRRIGQQYQKPTLVLFSKQVNSACGMANSAVGPFYCPADSRVYIDLTFYRDMQRKLNAPGEFARAYVLAHEVGHHVQRLLGYSARAERMAAQDRSRNRSSVRLELQADFLAGVWAHHAEKKFKLLESGDLESALNAAFQIGDDRLQKQGQGYVVPDSFTHGTSAQRKRWFTAGFKTGDVRQAEQLFQLEYDEL